MKHSSNVHKYSRKFDEPYTKPGQKEALQYDPDASNFKSRDSTNDTQRPLPDITGSSAVGNIIDQSQQMRNTGRSHGYTAELSSNIKSKATIESVYNTANAGVKLATGTLVVTAVVAGIIDEKLNEGKGLNAVSERIVEAREVYDKVASKLNPTKPTEIKAAQIVDLEPTIKRIMAENPPPPVDSKK